MVEEDGPLEAKAWDADLASSKNELVTFRLFGSGRQQPGAPGPVPKKSARQRKVPGVKPIPEAAGSAIKFSKGGGQLTGWHDVTAASAAKDEEGANSHACGFPPAIGGAWGLFFFPASIQRWLWLIRRTAQYTKVVASYHKEKTERSALACELETAQATAAQVPQLQEDLRLSREQCSQSQEVAKGLAAKVKMLEEELEWLRKQESEHQAELASVKQVGQEKVDSLNRKLGEVDEKCQRLSSEVTKQSTLLMETARKWTEDISRLDRGLAASFPETQAAALEAARLAREERRAAGEEGSPYFSMEEHLAVMQARITPITMLGHELRLAAEEIYRLLWPTETLPAELGRLVEWLNTSPDRIQDWKESSARAGADMALSFILSWYEVVSLDQLEFRRAGVEDTLSPETLSCRLARACAIADFINTAEFVADPNPPTEEEGEEEEAEDAEAVAAPDAEPASAAEAPPAGPSLARL
ncbi:hypothetical protein ACQ4PT_005132 [Festuca glaucescens]